MATSELNAITFHLRLKHTDARTRIQLNRLRRISAELDDAHQPSLFPMVFAAYQAYFVVVLKSYTTYWLVRRKCGLVIESGGHDF